jgi:hypothetical protein
MILTFITVLAYIGAVAATPAWLFCGWSAHQYSAPGNFEKFGDELKGIKRTWPVGKCLLIATISWAWLITTWVS